MFTKREVKKITIENIMEKNIKLLFIFLLSTYLYACSSDGSSDGGGSSSFNLSSEQLIFNAVERGTNPLIQEVTITPNSSSGFFYFAVEDYGLASLDCVDNICTIYVSVPDTSQVSAGSYEYQLKVKSCPDPFCSSTVGVSTRYITVIYNVASGVQLSTTPAQLGFIAQQNQAAPASQTILLNFINGVPDLVDTSVVYREGSNWLSINQSTNSLIVTASTLQPDTYSAEIIVTYMYSGSESVATIPVTYVVESLPSIDYVTPYLAYVNESQEVIVRGAGFSKITQPLTFNGVPATSISVINDTELRAIPPTLAVTGKYELVIENDEGVPTSTTELSVINKSSFNYAAVNIANTSNGGLSYKKIAYDEERKSIYYSKDVESISRARFTGSGWAIDSLPVWGQKSFSMSPDGKKLYCVKNSNEIYEIDLNTWQIVTTHKTTIDNLETISILSNGKAALTHGFDMSIYDFSKNRMSNVIGYSAGYDQEAIVSNNLDRVVLATRGTGAKIMGLDATDETFVNPGINVNVATSGSHIAINKDGGRVVINTNVYDDLYNLLGSLQTSSYYSCITISPDGTRAYIISSSTVNKETDVKVYDISGDTGPYTQIGTTIVLPDFTGYSPYATISYDGATLFIVGNENVIIFPVP